MWDTLFINGHLATMSADISAPYGAITDGALAVQNGDIVWRGKKRDLPDTPTNLAQEICDMNGSWLTPGLIDCHTHLVFGGNRAEEFEARLNGASYEEIARAGGGIISTVKATRDSAHDVLLASTQARAQIMQQEGVTTVEIKSGYGLDKATEVKMLQVARALENVLNIRVVTTFLGAHAVPPEYSNDRAGYLSLICEEMLPTIAELGLADAVDAFCEGIGFTRDETRQVFAAAAEFGLPVKLHAEQLSNQEGTQLAAEFDALSVDHLEYLSPDGIEAIQKSGTVAVILPGAFYFLRETRKPPIEALRRAEVPIAIASDCNPGSSPILSPLTIMNMACTLFQMTPEEAFRGMTTNAARALGRAENLGSLDEGKHADLAFWSVSHPAELSYWVGNRPLNALYLGGTKIH